MDKKAVQNLQKYHKPRNDSKCLPYQELNQGFQLELTIYDDTANKKRVRLLRRSSQISRGNLLSNRLDRKITNFEVPQVRKEEVEKYVEADLEIENIMASRTHLQFTKQANSIREDLRFSSLHSSSIQENQWQHIKKKGKVRPFQLFKPKINNSISPSNRRKLKPIYNIYQNDLQIRKKWVKQSQANHHECNVIRANKTFNQEFRKTNRSTLKPSKPQKHSSQTQIMFQSFHKEKSSSRISNEDGSCMMKKQSNNKMLLSSINFSEEAILAQSKEVTRVNNIAQRLRRVKKLNQLVQKISNNQLIESQRNNSQSKKQLPQLSHKQQAHHFNTGKISPLSNRYQLQPLSEQVHHSRRLAPISTQNQIIKSFIEERFKQINSPLEQSQRQSLLKNRQRRILSQIQLKKDSNSRSSFSNTKNSPYFDKNSHMDSQEILRLKNQKLNRRYMSQFGQQQSDDDQERPQGQNQQSQIFGGMQVGFSSKKWSQLKQY